MFVVEDFLIVQLKLNEQKNEDVLNKVNEDYKRDLKLKQQKYEELTTRKNLLGQSFSELKKLVNKILLNYYIDYFENIKNWLVMQISHFSTVLRI